MVSNFLKKKKSNAPNHVWLHVGGILVVMVLVILLIADIKLYQKKQEFLAQVASLKKQIEDVKTKNSKLQTGVSQASNEQYIEKVAREQLDLQKPGETAVSFVTPPNQASQANATKQGWFGWLAASWQWIKNNF